MQHVTPNLENNNYAHVQNANHIVALAVHAFLLQDVTSPPPQLLSRDIDLYISQVEHASGLILVEYLKYAGYPIIQWQRAARTAKLTTYKQLLAYSLHLVSVHLCTPTCVHT